MFFTEIGPKFAKEIERSIIKFDDYLDQYDTPVFVNELKDIFFLFI